MHFGGLVELATGEGKTVTASLPTFLNALVGKGVHVTTVNDYLAKRDAEWIGPVYEKLGLIGRRACSRRWRTRTGPPRTRRDVTYGTASEFGFDFLRDRLKVRGGQAAGRPVLGARGCPAATPAKLDPRVQRGLHFAIVDEADSIFIDEAKTPLIIANPTRLAEPEEQVVYLWADRVARDDEARRALHPEPEEGQDRAHRRRPAPGPLLQPADRQARQGDGQAARSGRAGAARPLPLRPRPALHGQSRRSKIVIIDEGTGRPMPDRHWRDGLHQAVEAKEGVPINMASDHAAQITFQNFYRLYTKLAGMSGTLLPNFWELRKVYRLWTTLGADEPAEQARGAARRGLPTEDAKFDAVVEKTPRDARAPAGRC